LRVRNAIYEHVFDEQWARDHLELNVNWRRRLARLAAALLVLTVLVTIPLAVFAWRQKTEAEYQAAQAMLERDEAQRQRDEAHRQRLIAETSMRDSLVALSTADKPIEELKRYNPASAAAIELQIASARAEAQREFQQRLSELRAERDDALKKLDATRRALAAAGRSTPPPKPLAQLEIEKVLEAYEAAYAAKDVDLLRRVQVLSSSDARAIRNEFAAAMQYRVNLQKVDIRIAPDGRTAMVTADVHRALTGTRGGSGFHRENGVKTFVLERRREGWMIVSVR
jgi:ketosteroid isomerase-like protein